MAMFNYQRVEMVFLCDDVFFTISQQDRAASDWAQLNVGDFRRLQSGLEGLSRDVSPKGNQLDQLAATTGAK